MKNLNLVLVILLFFALSTDSSAQAYKSAAGLRLGAPFSLSYKTFISESSALEATIGTRRYGYSGLGFGFAGFGYRTFVISGSYQIHKPINIDEFSGLEWYFGGGASANFWSYDGDFGNDNSKVNLGIQGYIGLSYSFDEVPINLILDWVPTFLINGIRGGFGAGYGALGVRYIISR